MGLVPPVSPEGKGKYAGNPIVIFGGSSSVGQNGNLLLLSRDFAYNLASNPDSAIQLAKLSGFSPIIVTASLQHTETLKSLGATHIIDRNASDFALASEINTITQNAPIKYAVDSVSSAETQQFGYDLLAPGGKLAIFLEAIVNITEEKDIIRTIGFSRHPPNIELLGTLYHDHLERFLKEGDIKVSPCKVLFFSLHC